MASWSELTHKILTNVLGRVSVSDRWLGAMFVCKPWLRACKDPLLNKSLDLEPWFGSAPDSARFWQPEFERRIDAMVRNVVEWSEGGVVEIRVRHCSDQYVAFVAERCPKLQVLSVKSSPHVSDGSMEKDGDSEAAAIGNSMLGLEHLELKFSKLTAQGLTRIVEGCVELQYLDLFGCLNLTSRDIANATEKLTKLRMVEKPNFHVPRSVYLSERYGHWQLYDERFQTDVFRI